MAHQIDRFEVSPLPRHSVKLTTREIEVAASQQTAMIGIRQAGDLFGYDEDGDIAVECGRGLVVISTDGDEFLATVSDHDERGVYYDYD